MKGGKKKKEKTATKKFRKCVTKGMRPKDNHKKTNRFFK